MEGGGASQAAGAWRAALTSRGVRSLLVRGQGHREADMDTTTLVILIIILVIVLGGGWYGRGRWF
jgi:hypothetical protein